MTTAADRTDDNTTRTVDAWGVTSLGAPLERLQITRRPLRDDDVRIRVDYSGICHSDIHNVRGDFGPRPLPLVPGHEIVGTVVGIGSEVSRFSVGDRVGVGCFSDSCGHCDACLADEEGYCENGTVMTYASENRYTDGEVTQGGYATEIVTRDTFVLRVPDSLDPAAAAPLLCAGITAYAPLKHWGAGPGRRVAVVGMGGVGHVAVKIAVALGAEVTVLSHSETKREEALGFGAVDLVSTADGSFAESCSRRFDLILNTVSVDLDTASYMATLAFDGVMVQIGLPEQPLSVPVRMLTGQRRSLAGSLVGGIAETQDMLDFCAEHGVTAEIELIDAADVNEAYDRAVRSDVRYRFVIDAATI
jgi:uncharacterized zinc-type alcohol dehydrogenase-like protein